MIVMLLWGCVQPFETRNFPPVIQSFQPEADSVFNSGDNLLFEITVDDPDTPYPNVLIRVESDIDGIFLSGFPDANGQFNQAHDELSLGTHTLNIGVFDDSNNFISTTSTITVNSPPSLDSVLLYPEEPTTDDTLEVFISEGFDLDNDVISLTYRWYKNGALQPDLIEDAVENTLTSKGDVWMVEIVPNDTYGAGQPVAASTIIRNQAPTTDSVTITPGQDVHLGTELSCLATGSDSDEEAVLPSIMWQILSGGNFYDYTAEESTFTPYAPLVQPGDVVRCTALFTDPDGAVSESLHTSIDVANRNPTVDQVLVVEENGQSVRTGASLNCIATATDPEGSEVTLAYVWKNGTTTLAIDNNVPNGEPTTLTVSGGNVARGDVITCEVTAADPHGGSGTGTSTGSTVVNSPPVLDSIGINENPDSRSDVTCIPVVNDADGDTVSFEVVWTINGNVVQTGSAETLAGPFDPLDVVTCQFTPNDGQTSDNLGDSMIATTTVVNTLPTVVDVVLEPSPVYTDTLLVANVNASDYDGATVLLSYDWYVDGNLVKSGYGNSLDGSQYYQRNQQVNVEVTPNDGLGSGQLVPSNVVTVENTPPLITSAIILPENPVPATDDLVCSSGDPITDSDNDALNYDFLWMKNGDPYVDGTTDTNLSNDTVPAAFTTDGDIWTCEMVVDDGYVSTSASSPMVSTVCLNGYGEIPGCPATSCLDVIENKPSSYTDDGLYWLDPDGAGAYEAYCDMTHDGGGWTLLMRALGFDDTLDYDAIYWESTATINETQNQPNIDVNGVSAKFEAYNSVVGTSLRLSFVEPTQHNIHYDDMGTCTDGVKTTVTDCVEDGICSDSQWTNETDCLANGACDDNAYTDQADCENNGQTWTPFIWQPHEWIDGLTALELFSGPEIMIQGVVLGYDGGCREGLLTQDFSGDMQFVYQSQFFGFNGHNISTSGSTSDQRESKIRFGYGSGIQNYTNSGWGPQIGIGTHVRYSSYIGQYYYVYEHSTIWLDPDATNTCGTYGNGLGAAAEDAVSNLWIR